MKPSEARALLLRQHDRILELLDEAMAGVERGESPRGAFLALRLALVEHAASEEALLVPFLRHGGAWSQDRIHAMLAEHLAEHAAFRAALDDPAGGLEGLAAALRAHMAEEERSFLAAGALPDSLVTVGVTS